MKPRPPDQPIGELRYLAGGEVDRSSVSLRFFGDDLDPAAITHLLGCEPTRAHRKGDVLPNDRYQLTAQSGAWILSGARVTEPDLQGQIQALFACLPNAPVVWEQLRPFQGDLFCGLWLRTWNRELAISPEVARAIADRHLQLDLDIYFETSEDTMDSER